MPDTLSTLAGAHPGVDDGAAVLRRRQRLYRVTTVVLVALIALAVADSFAPVLGVDAGTVRAEAPDGTELRVDYPEVTRPALASPFAVEVERAGGFEGPIEIAVSRPWIEIWDENGFYPTPSAETGDEDWVVYEFDPPDGDVFRFFYDARLEPARQTSADGTVELRRAGARLASVSFRTEVRP